MEAASGDGVPVQALDVLVAERLHAATVLGSAMRVVEELVLNSLDAGARSVVLELDLPHHALRVTDTGAGMQREELRTLVGTVRASSKRSRPAGVGPGSYGVAGEAIKSLVAVAHEVEIRSRVSGAVCGVVKRMQAGEVVGCDDDSSLPVGTSIAVRGLFHAFPVRQKAANPARQWDRIREWLSRMAVLHHRCRFLVRDMCGTTRRAAPMFQAEPSASVRLAFRKMVAPAPPARQQQHSLEAVQVTLPGRPGYRLHGLISAPTVEACHVSKQHQLVFVNNRWIRSANAVEKTVNACCARYLATHAPAAPVQGSEAAAAAASARQHVQQFGGQQRLRQTRTFPVFVLQLHCPDSECDVLVEADKATPLFAHADVVEQLCVNFFDAALHVHGLDGSLPAPLSQPHQLLQPLPGPDSAVAATGRASHLKSISPQFSGSYPTPIPDQQAPVVTHTLPTILPPPPPPPSMTATETTCSTAPQQPPLTFTEAFYTPGKGGSGDHADNHAKLAAAQNNDRDGSVVRSSRFGVHVVRPGDERSALERRFDALFSESGRGEPAAYNAVHTIPSPRANAAEHVEGHEEREGEQEQQPKEEDAEEDPRPNQQQQQEEWTAQPTTRPHRFRLEDAQPIVRTVASMSAMAALRVLEVARGTPSLADCSDGSTLGRCEVIGQLDAKFILVSVNSQICCIDQHAAHERVRLEELEAALVEDVAAAALGSSVAVRGEVLQSRPEDPPLQLTVTDADWNTIRGFADVFAAWGLVFDCSSAVTVTMAPVATQRRVSVTHLPVVCGVRFSPADVREFVAHVQQVESSAAVMRKCPSTQNISITTSSRSSSSSSSSSGGGSSMRIKLCQPPAVKAILASRACRGAIMFGDVLSPQQCVDLIRDLSSCRMPGYCAHGRPSVLPLVTLADCTAAATTGVSTTGVQRSILVEGQMCRASSVRHRGGAWKRARPALCRLGGEDTSLG